MSTREELIETVSLLRTAKGKYRLDDIKIKHALAALDELAAQKSKVHIPFGFISDLLNLNEKYKLEVSWRRIAKKQCEAFGFELSGDK
jgi:hypothetical protein